MADYDYNLILGTQFDEKQAKTEFDSIVALLNDTAKKKGKITVQTDFGGEDGTQQVIGATRTYTDALGNLRKEVFSLTKAENEEAKFRMTGVSYIEDSIKAREEELSVVQKQIEAAERFLSKSKNMDLANPDVIAARAKAQEILNLGAKGMEGPIASPEMMQKATSELRVLNEATKQVGQSTRSWTEGLRNAIKHVIEYATGLQLVYGAMNQLRDGVNFVKDLDKVMTDIQMVGASGAKTDEEIKQLAMTFNDLGKEMGASTIEVGKGKQNCSCKISLTAGKSLESILPKLYSNI